MHAGDPIVHDRAVFLADAHLNQDDIHSRNFLLLAEKAAQEKVALFLLGDVFDLWFGAPGLTFRYQQPIVERLRALRCEGLRLYYVEGNRDFYLKSPHEGSTFDAVSEGDMRAAVGERRLLLSHGDTVNRGDLGYRFWKAISKNRLAYGAASLLPPRYFLPLASRIERKLKRGNRRFRESFPETECREYALRIFAQGIDVVVLGHFHTEQLLRFSREPAGKALAVLPSWRAEWRYLCLTADGEPAFRSFRRDAPLLPQGPTNRSG